MQVLKTLIDSVCIDGENIYFFDRLCCSLWRSDIHMDKIEFIRDAYQDIDIEGFLSFGIFKSDESIYIGSQSGIDIIEYRLKENKFYKFSFNRKSLSIYNHIAFGDDIYIFPTNMNESVITFNMHEKEFEEKVPIAEKNEVSGFISKTENYVYLPVAGGQKIYEYNLTNDKVRKIEFSSKINIISALKDKNTIYAADREKGKLWKKHGNNENDIVYSVFQKYEAVSKLIKYKDYIIAIPRLDKYLIVYDTISQSIVKVEVPLPEEKEFDGCASLFCGYYKTEEHLCFLPWMIPKIYMLDLQAQVFTLKDLSFSTNRRWIDSHKILYEDSLDLKEYMCALHNGGDSDKKLLDFAYGERIYQEISK